MKEESLYKYVEKFLKEEFNCFETEQKCGVQGLGIADVIGIRDIGGRHSSDVEVVTVEVKLDTDNFGKKCGQALGYSILAHKCYLAVYFKNRQCFSQEEKEIANRLGIGLIEIRRKKCKEVLSSSYHQPITALMNSVMLNLQYSKCSICGQLTSAEWSRKLKRSFVDYKDFRMKKYPTNFYDKRIKLLFTRSDEPSRLTWICRDCVRNLELGKE